MSGGRLNYQNDILCSDLFGYSIYGPDYGLSDQKNKDVAKRAANEDPFKDAELSEIVWDVFCILHSWDWYMSGDTCESDFREDVEYFKKKWLGRKPAERQKDVIDATIERAREQIYKQLCIEEPKSE